ncbi:hypothetical protein [Clostridium hydrogenum]|uniref:hypothetical protein n=1 Tax=Clostridium hydrogenum TaxID=2855764 RepID=UPI001F42F905|nr:hypothetical protein [Clostridium hydrogenum]
MKCFKIDRIDKVTYAEDYSMVVIAEDKIHAERCARLESRDFKKAKLKVTEINMDIEQVALVANTGA